MAFWTFLVLQLVIFAGLIFFLRQILNRNLTHATAHLQLLSAEYAKRHDELKQQLQEAERQYQEQITKAKVEADQLVTQARQDAESSKTRLLEQARSESERIVQQAVETGNGMRQEAEQTIARLAIDRACELIHEVLPGQLRQEVQARWLDEVLRDGLAQLDKMTMNGEVESVKVVSAFPLSQAQQDLVQKRLSDKLGRPISLEQSTDERLVAGVTITLGSLILDGSLASKVREAARQAAKDM